MHLVAIVPRPTGSTRSGGIADELARVTGLSLYEARTRLRVLGDTPGVLATFAARAQAEAVVQADQLRGACTSATWNDRLQQRGEQARMLGPTLRPERNLDVAIALLTRNMGDVADPYR